MLLLMAVFRYALKIASLIFSVLLLMACGIATSTPTAIVTRISTSTLSNLVSTLPQDTPSATMEAMRTPTQHASLAATSSLADEIRLYHNHVASRTVSDKYSFSVVVMNNQADFVPKSIQIVESRTRVPIGQYELFTENEMPSLCSNLMQNPALIFYETVLIDHSDFPQGFIIRAYEGDFIFRITVEYSSGVQEITELTMPQDVCYSAVQ